MSETKLCRGCDIVKPVSDFHRRGPEGGYKSKCRPCRSVEKATLPSYAAAKAAYKERYASDPEFRQLRKDQERARRYGLTPEGVAEMLARQGGRCAICRTGNPGVEGRYWLIDHDHRCCPGIGSCGRCVRALLCVNCNTGLGQFRDDVDVMKSAIEYLEAHRG